MKKYLFILLAALAFTACSDDDENDKGRIITGISESELSENVRDALKAPKNFRFTDSNYHVITTAGELEAVWQGGSELADAAFFDNYSIIAGVVEAPDTGWSIKKMVLMEDGKDYRLDVYMQYAGSGFCAITWNYFWAVYPKLSSKSVTINLLKADGSPYTFTQEQYVEQVVYYD